MAKLHVRAVLETAGAIVKDGWHEVPEGKSISVYAARAGVGLTVMRVTAVREEAPLVYLRTSKGETFMLEIDDVFAGAVEGATASNRKAGFL